MTDPPAYVTREEFERRMRALEGGMRVLGGEVEGEKAVTRHVLEHARLNGNDLAAMKTQLVHLEDDMVLVKTSLNTHGTRLNVLTQDVREIRTRLDGMDAKLDAVLTQDV